MLALIQVERVFVPPKPKVYRTVPESCISKGNSELAAKHKREETKEEKTKAAAADRVSTYTQQPISRKSGHGRWSSCFSITPARAGRGRSTQILFWVTFEVSDLLILPNSPIPCRFHRFAPKISHLCCQVGPIRIIREESRVSPIQCPTDQGILQM